MKILNLCSILLVSFLVVGCATNVNTRQALESNVIGSLEGTIPVKLQIAVTEFDIQSGAARLFVGVFAGSNKMTAAIKVIDGTGKTVAEFDVQRSANPGGYGAFYSQTGATFDAVADGIAEVLSGKSGYRRDL